MLVMTKHKDKTIGERVRAWRDGGALTQKEAASKLRVKLRTLQEWEQERRTRPRFDTIQSVLARLEADGF
jgi:transcriptional regulator with XRE-family HTH domain